MSVRRAQGRAASSEQRCFEIMNMNDKHSYSLLMRPADFSAEKIFLQNFQRKNFFKIFFSRIFSGKIFSKFFSPEFSAEKFFQNFFLQNFQRKIFFKNFFLQNFQRKKFFKIFFLQNFQRNIFSASLSGTQELNLSGYPFHLTKAFFFFWSRRITFSIRKIF